MRGFQTISIVIFVALLTGSCSGGSGTAGASEMTPNSTSLTAASIDEEWNFWAAMGIIGLTGVATIAVAAVCIYSLLYDKGKPGDQADLFSFFEKVNALRMLAVCLIIAAVVYLATLGQLSGEATASLLAGIAGYVLGSMSSEGKSK